MKKILYVEDYEMGRDMLSRRLARKGFECICASDGGQAVEFAHREHPDLIVIDVSLPVKSSLEVTQELKTAEDTKHIPMIILYTITEDRDKILNAGCEEHQIKPIEFPALLAKMNRLLSHSK
ncbi:response regulator [Candidatus Albibeggiatoa sp. nov. NOAA]|uniref:response regulator n=1 Tax=Candidatus Albibeggiatoa sp. nov. NOAA TaxID=3162724 RepID=UPI0032FEFE14|nr:response regulator [Thiotrichaceae bacterium]